MNFFVMTRYIYMINKVFCYCMIAISFIANNNSSKIIVRYILNIIGAPKIRNNLGCPTKMLNFPILR